MNAAITHARLTQVELDQLVEGELSLAERQRVVAALAESPDGWRRCALAFLEAQSWRSSMRAVVGTADAAPASSVVASPVAASNGRTARFALEVGASSKSAAKVASPSAAAARDLRATLLSWSAAALALVLAVGLGYATGFQNSPSPGDARHGQDALPVEVNDNTGGFEPFEAEQPLIAGDPNDPALRLVGTVKFDGADQPLPVVSGPGLDEEWLRNQPPLLSDYERSLLAQRGWRLKEDRQIITVQLADGSKLAIPVDALEYQYVGNKVY